MSEHRLDKLVVERPRRGGGIKTPPGSKKKWQKNGYEGKTRESLRRPWQESNCAKDFSDHLGPLRRLLRSKIGQHWDDIYSELCQRLDRNTVTGQHVFHHIWGIVERNVVLVDGVPYPKIRSRHAKPFPLGHWRETLYINPETGILCLTKKLPKSDSGTDLANRIFIDTNHCYQQINHVWYIVTLRDIPQGEIVWDVVQKAYVKRHHWDSQVRSYAVRKHQCNKKEIKRIEQQIILH